MQALELGAAALDCDRGRDDWRRRRPDEVVVIGDGVRVREPVARRQLDNVGAVAGTLENDIDGGVIGAAQYDTWVANFGNSSSGSGNDAAVPEPSTIALLAALTMVLGLHRRKS